MLCLLSISPTPFRQSYSPGCLSPPAAAGTAPSQVHNFCICLFRTSWHFCQPVVLRPLWTVALPSNYGHYLNFVSFPKTTKVCSVSVSPVKNWAVSIPKNTTCTLLPLRPATNPLSPMVQSILQPPVAYLSRLNLSHLATRILWKIMLKALVKQQSLALPLLRVLAISNRKVIWSVEKSSALGKYMTTDPDPFFPSVCLEIVSLRTCFSGTEVKLIAQCSHRYFLDFSDNGCSICLSNY